jgi:5,5'-dehydrodivanillate O-demethylase
MLTVEQNERLTRVGPGTPCGELMRRYWHPIAATSQMKDRYTMAIRILGEDLVLYKDRSGIFGLIDAYCPHRRMGMIYGIAEEHGLRCPYHGWLFDETGRTLEMPYEETEDSETQFKNKVRIHAYRVHQQSGMIFVYMGPEPAPLFPQWDLYSMEGVTREIGMAVLPCNWLQIQENSLDPVHVEWLHQYLFNYVTERVGRTDLARPVLAHKRIGFDVSEYGIIKRRVVEGGSEEDEDWKVGHPIIFPNILRNKAGVGKSGEGFQIRTPLDDTHTAHWWYYCYPQGPDDPQAQRDEDIPHYTVPVPQLDEKGEPRWELLLSAAGQDLSAWVTQGEIADRRLESLGRSDKGIILFRRMLEENIRIVEDGGDPKVTFRDPSTNVNLTQATENMTRAGAANNMVTQRRSWEANPSAAKVAAMARPRSL